MPLKPTKINNKYPLTQNNILFTFQLYLKSWINIILKERLIYPPTSFETRNSFNLQVPWQRHPDFNVWCDEMCDNLINDANVFQNCKNISLLIYDTINDDEIGKIKERYVINIQEFFHNISPNINWNLNKHVVDKENQISWNDIHLELRANLYSLITKIRSLEKIRIEGLKFNISCETMGNVMNDKDWVLDDSTDYPTGTLVTNPNDLIPLRTVDVGPMIIHSSIEVYK